MTTPRISSKQKKTEFKMKIKTLDSDEGIKIDSRRGTKLFLNRRPSGSYVVEIVRGRIVTWSIRVKTLGLFKISTR